MKPTRVIYIVLLLLSFCFLFGKSGHAQVTETYCSTDVPIAIPDAGLPAESNLNVPDSGVISDVVLKLQINHANIGQLEVSLMSPSSTNALLIENIGAGANFGALCSPMPDFILDDASGTAVSSSGGLPGTYFPEPQSLSLFDLEDQLGTWTLIVNDEIPRAAGTLNCWCLDITIEPERVEGCCVLGQSSCLITTADECSAEGGLYQGDDTSCNQIRQCFAPTLTPLTATNEVFTDHTVTATFLLAGIPEEGVLVDFEVISGPNTGEMSDPDSGECAPNDDCTTDANGQVSWAYLSSKLGTDTIVATIDDGEIIESNTVEKTWIVIRNIPALSEWGMLMLTIVLGVSAVIYLMLRSRRKSI